MIEMGETANTPLQRLRYRRILENRLVALEGVEFHIPVLDTDAEQQLIQRPDYEDLLVEFYCDPEPNDTDLKKGDIVYEITGVSVNENSSARYWLDRALRRTQFDAQIQMTLDFKGPTPNSLNTIEDCPFYHEEEAKFRREVGGEQWLFFFDWDGMKKVDEMLAMFNQSMACVWNTAKTIEEAERQLEAWKQFNQAKERWR